MRLTADLIADSPSFMNAVHDRELDLRNNKLQAIENLGASKDQHDTIDLTNNDIRILHNFPRLLRLQTLICCNNRINKIASEIGEQLPNLQTLVLTNNALADLSDLASLHDVKQLTHIVLLDNPVIRRDHYREFLIWRCPTLRVIDFQRIRDKERVAAKKLFETTEGELTSLAKSIIEPKSTNVFTPGEGVGGVAGSSTTAGGSVPSIGLSAEDQAKIREAIKNAKSLDEVANLERMLRAGHVPGAQKQA
ncbi:L domain-like protein [Syncephalis plumigaleata]|nr:L domain-like protein [Syncephalis plumigaleata]